MAKEQDSAAQQQPEEPTFEVGEAVIIREDFHSKYFRGLHGTIAGPPRKGGTALPLWPVKLAVPPYETLMAAKYLRRPTPAEREARTGNENTAAPAADGAARKSWLSRILPWGRA